MQTNIVRTAALSAFIAICISLAIGVAAFTDTARPSSAYASPAAQEEKLQLIDVCHEQVNAIEAELEAEAEAARIAEEEAKRPASVRRAEAALGTPYRSGASGPNGFDCSGLVSYCLTGNYGHAYTSYSFWGMPAVSDPVPGDVVACSPGHCGLYIGDGLMIHAPQSGEYVRVEAVRGKIVRP